LPCVVCVHVDVLCTKVAPLKSVDGTKVTLLTGAARAARVCLSRGMLVSSGKEVAELRHTTLAAMARAASGWWWWW
jgi:hypothetical protein